MPAQYGVKQLNKAIEKLEQQKLWEFYCSVYVHLKEKKPFEEFYRQAKTKVKKAGMIGKRDLTKEEIIAMAEKIRIKHIMQQAKQDRKK